MTNLKEIIRPFVYHWWGSVGIIRRMSIEDEYQKQEGVNDVIVEGLTSHAEEWLLMNFTDDIKDYVILNHVHRTKNKSFN